MRLPRLPPALVPLLVLAAAGCAPASASESAISEGDGTPIASASSALSTLTEVTSFGTNPGALKMFEYVPAGLAAGAPLVLVLHGCTETADSSAATGWNELADEAHFAVVYPEQEIANNSLRCFNWAGEYGDPSDIQRGKGENLSIKQMVDKAIATHGSDPARVFVVGFSAGGGTAAIMAATYPDVVAGAATMGGLPYDCTTTYAEINTCMKPGKTKTAAEWAALVKAGDPGFAGPWPRMSIWQGSADTTVAPANRTELVKQWTGVHGIDGVTPATDTVDGQSHAVYKDSSGKVLVETYEVAGMAHGVPVVASAKCGAASSYAIDKGICASRHVATFFGLIAAGPSPADAGADATKPASPSGAVSSSSSTGGASGDGGPAASGSAGASGGVAPGDANGRYGSTCTVGHVGGGASSSSSSVFALLGSLLTLTVAIARHRSRSRITKAVPR